jgi:hypothetical protein
VAVNKEIDRRRDGWAALLKFGGGGGGKDRSADRGAGWIGWVSRRADGARAESEV